MHSKSIVFLVAALAIGAISMPYEMRAVELRESLPRGISAQEADTAWDGKNSKRSEADMAWDVCRFSFTHLMFPTEDISPS